MKKLLKHSHEIVVCCLVASVILIGLTLVSAEASAVLQQHDALLVHQTMTQAHMIQPE